MTQYLYPDLGFDIERVRTILISWLVQHGIVRPELSPRLASCGDGKGESVEDEWSPILDVILPHMSLHGAPQELLINGERRDSRCPDSRCQAAAVCLALYELWIFVREFEQTASLTRNLETVARHLSGLDLAAIEEPVRTALEKMEPLIRAVRPEYLGSVEELKGCLSLVADLRKAADEAAELRDFFQSGLRSRELRHAAPKRGRPRRWLLTAVR